MSTETDQPTVHVGQVWADNDPRAEGRTMRVDAVEYSTRMGKHVALCTILTNSAETDRDLAGGNVWRTDRRGKTTRVAVSRMRPTATGYRLLTETEED